MALTHNSQKKIPPLLHPAAKTLPPEDTLPLQSEIQRFNGEMNKIIQNMPPVLLKRLEIRFYSFHKDLIRPDTGIREHEHPNYELALIKRGGMTSICDNTKIYCSTRNKRIFFMPPATLHYRRFDGEINIVLSMVLSIIGTDETGRRLCHRLPEIIREKGFCIEPASPVTFLLDEIERQTTDRRLLVSELIQYYLQALIAVFFQEHFPELFEAEENTLMPLSGISDAYRIVEIKRFVEHTMNAPVSLKIFEKRFGLSGRHLNRIFRKETGKTLIAYAAERKLLYAEKLLSDSNASISEIAKSLAFRNLTMFSIFFHKHKGCSPSAFRKTSKH